MAEPPPRVLGQLLLAAGAVSPERLEEALEEQRHTRERLGGLLVRRGVSPEAIARALAAQLRLPYAQPPIVPEPAALGLVDRALALRLRVVPIALGERTLRVAMADPLDVRAVDDLQFQTGRRVEPVVATPDAVEEALTAIYGPEPGQAARKPSPPALRPASAHEPAEPDDVSALRRASEAPPIVALVDLILERAIANGASDIHIEPAGGRLRVRARIDGLLRELLELPEHTGGAVTSRIKVMAGLDIAIKRRPQDGRAAIHAQGREFSFRVSTLPTENGEKVVLRLLDPANTGQRLDQLGFSPHTHDRFVRLLGRGHGVILVTGPTGSGKTTTLYAALASLDRERRNIITLEDPIEYRLPGLTQVQVHHRAGLTFATALRAVLRQDPDVIMVGEMRDRETVEVGLAAALTGHLVLSTLHTNDAPGAVARLVEMGAPPYLVAGALIGVLAQRLARRLCPDCRVPCDPDPDRLRTLGLPPHTLYAPRGCPRCDGQGYRGRTGVFELLVVNGRIRELILRRASADAIRDAARDAGMEPMSHDAWRKLRDGTTSLEEIEPLLTLLADEAPLCPECGAGLRTSYVACPGCGRRLRDRCACGATLESDWRCCAYCGAPRNSGASTKNLSTLIVKG